MDGLEEKVLGYTSSSNLQSPAETSARVAATCVTVGKLGESGRHHSKCSSRTTPFIHI